MGPSHTQRLEIILEHLPPIEPLGFCHMSLPQYWPSWELRWAEHHKRQKGAVHAYAAFLKGSATEIVAMEINELQKFWVTHQI